MARRAGLSSKAISALERGERRRPYPHTLRALVAALELSSEERTELQASVAGRRSSAANGTQPGQHNEAQRAAAWSLYVEMATRVSVIGLTADQGMLREALTSLHSLFASTRGILRQYGPAVAESPGGGAPAVDELATDMLNEILRPVLSEWHPLLSDHEARRPPGVTPREHERAWSQNGELRAALEALRADLSWYAQTLAGIAGVRGR